MKAVLFVAPGQLEVTTVDDPEPGPRQVVVDVAACGLCGTDLHILQGEFAPRLPVVPGHEFAGTVVAVGREVTTIAVGDQVCADPNLYCGECYYCRRGRNNLCENFAAVGVTMPGAAADLVAVPAANCVLLPQGIDPRDAALVEPLSCVVHAFDVLQMRIDDHVLVYGAGTIGLMVLQLAKAAGAASVDVVDVNAGKLAIAQKLGCRHAATDAAALEMPRGWDVVVDCTGAVPAIEDGLRRVRRGGTFVQLGMTKPEARASFQPYRIFDEEIRIVGSRAVLRSYERAAQLFLDGLVDPSVFVSHRYHLDDYAEALDLVAAGTARKVLVEP